MADHLVVCIARQFGSAGHEVGARLAKKLDVPYYDKELLRQAAEKSGILQELFEKNDERPVGLTGGKATSYADYIGYMPGDQIQGVLADVIRDAAAKSSCVIVGRCADYILRGQRGMVSVFVHAPLEQRIKRVQRMHNLDEDAARALIRKTDRGRANYYSYYTDRNWGDADNYDLVVNAGRLGVDESAELLAGATAYFRTL